MNTIRLKRFVSEKSLFNLTATIMILMPFAEIITDIFARYRKDIVPSMFQPVILSLFGVLGTIIVLLCKIDEKKIGESRDAISENKAAIQRICDKLDVLNIDLEAKREELSKIVESTSKEEKVLVKKRDELAAKLDERTLSAYNRIRASVHNHLAVVTVYNGDSCGGCFNTVTPQRLIEIASGKKLVICEHCGRIIVATPQSAE